MVTEDVGMSFRESGTSILEKNELSLNALHMEGVRTVQRTE